MDNWIKRGRVWRHRHNARMKVMIMATHAEQGAKYFVFHTHPGYMGIVIPQKMEKANTMKRAHQLAEVHLKHWNDSTAWKTDKDFGKAN